MLCNRCGSQIQDGADCCARCGNPIFSTEIVRKKRKIDGSVRWLIILYIAVLCIVLFGFHVGDGYAVYDNGLAAAIHSSYFWQQKYGWEQLEEMFDGCIDKYEGWYGLSWKHTYSLYQNSEGLTREQFESFYTNVYECPEGFLTWSESEYVEFISDYSVYSASDLNYVWITLNGEFVIVEFGPTNVVDDYRGVIPKVIASCAALLLLPLFSYVAFKIICRKRLSA